MIIHFDVDGYNGVVPYGVHQYDTTDPKVIATLTACKGNPAAQAAAGLSAVHKVAGRPLGETRWQFLISSLQGAPANDPVVLLGLT